MNPATIFFTLLTRATPNRLITTPKHWLLLGLLCVSASAQAERIKDLATVAGVRDNYLVGYGLVVGLDGTGDSLNKTQFTRQSLRAMLSHYGITMPDGVNPDSKNIAAVMVHANLSAFTKPGQRFDITVSSLGDSKSLRGGSLLMTPLKGADGKVYALAQGSLVVNGFGINADDGSSITVNVPSTASVPNGATLELAVPSPFASSSDLYLNLNTADFTSAKRVVQAINKALGPKTAEAMDAVTIKVQSPLNPDQRVGFVSFLENIRVQPGQAPARVIVNSRTGTVVIGSNVTVSPAAVSHGSLTVSITNNNTVSQPNPLTDGETTPVVNSDIDVSQSNDRMFLFKGGVSLQEIVTAVNQVGAAPGDLVAILEALKQAGALRAELVVI